VTVAIANDSQGAPGTVIETLTIAQTPAFPIGGNTPVLSKVTSTLHPLLSAGTTYWIEVLSANAVSFGGWYADPDRLNTMALDLSQYWRLLGV
jgi:hypothetical protein